MGEPCVDRLASHMTVKQLRGWMAYYEIEPWGEDRADLRAGIVAATVANAYRARGPALKPGDFMPVFDKPRQQTQAEQLALFKHFAAMHNAAQALKNG